VYKPFARFLRTLEDDGFGRMALWLALVSVLLAAWAAWFFLARVSVFAVSDKARLEIDRAVHSIEAPVGGPIVSVSCALGDAVQAGDVLVTLDAEGLRLELLETQARLATFAGRLAKLNGEIDAEQEAQLRGQRAAAGALAEARAWQREAEVAAHYSKEEAARVQRLSEQGHIARADVDKSAAEAEGKAQAAHANRLSADSLEWEQRTRESDRRARLERLRAELTALEGEQAVTTRGVARLEHEIQRRLVRAPVAGVIGELSQLRVGTVVREADALGAIVPHDGKLQIVAEFPPAAALGRILPGQPAWLRLEGFPWTEYGSFRAQVLRVAAEAREGTIRVELGVLPSSGQAALLQHGLPGSIEIQVERQAPSTLVLRALGKLLGAPAEPPP
jgi:membrane fusion protein (multidrug efflux system)